MKALYYLIYLSTVLSPLWAQERQITGTVTSDDETGPFLRATVVVKGTTIGTTTDIDVPADNTILVFSAIGVQTSEMIFGNSNTIDFVLKIQASELNEVVITALGIKGERDKFASSASTVKGKDVATSGETVALQGLSGKSAEGSDYSQRL